MDKFKAEICKFKNGSFFIRIPKNIMKFGGHKKEDIVEVLMKKTWKK